MHAATQRRTRKGKPDRFPRFASGARTLNVHLDDTDRAIMATVERCRLADENQLYLSCGPTTKRDTFKRHLMRLYRGEYLNRPPSQLNRWWTKGQPTLAYVYGLGPNGYAVLHPDEAGARSTAQLRLRDQRIGVQGIDHRLQLTTALLSFELGAAAEDLTLTWSEGDAMREATGLKRYVHIPETKTPQPLNPDSLITVDTANFFLEIDMGTEPIDRTGSQRWQRSSIRRKFHVYQQLAPRRGDTDTERKHRAPFPFRVLTITTTAARMESMRQLTREMDPKKKGSRLYLYSTFDRFSLERPADILTEAVWWSANDDDQPFSLID